MEPKENMERISFTITADLNRKLRSHLEKMGGPPISWAIRLAIKEFLERKGI